MGVLLLLAGCAEPGLEPLGSRTSSPATTARSSGSGDGFPVIAWGAAEVGASGTDFGQRTRVAGDTDGDGYDDLLVTDGDGNVFLYLGGPYGLALEPVWTVGTAGGEYALIAGGGDVDGDGYEDVAVGEVGYDGTWTDEGRVDLYLGGPGGPSTSPDWTYTCGQTGAACGAVALDGDVDGDGYHDVLVGASKWDGGRTDAGQVMWFPGSAAGPASTPDWSYVTNQAATAFGAWVAYLGDVNGDGYDDLGVGATTYDNGTTDEGQVFAWYGGASGPGSTPNFTADSGQASAWLGGITAAGDVNGDGYDDAIAGAYGFDGLATGDGRLYLYLGGVSGLGPQSWNWATNHDYDTLGFAGRFGAAGDVDGDGYDDVVAGNPLYLTSWGLLYVFRGSATGLPPSPDTSWTDNTSNSAGLGISVTAGDFDRDGYSDVVAGASDADVVWQLPGSVDGVVTSGTWTDDISRTNDGQMGVPIVSAGDTNGDGYDDVVMGSGDQIEALAYEGSATGLESVVHAYLEANPEDADRAVDGGIDIDGDGYDDVITSFSERIRVYTGSSTGLSATRYQEALGDQALAGFGESIAAVGDVDGDGYGDIVVGAPRYDDGETNEGRVFLYSGGSGGIDIVWDWDLQLDVASAWFGSSVAPAGDVDGDGFDDVLVGAERWSGSSTWEGSIWLLPGSASGLSTTSTWQIEGGQDFAYCHRARGVGDINGDGYDDVVVGCPDYDDAGIDDGKVDLHLGGVAGLSATPDWSRSGDGPGARIGAAVTGLGDIDADGYDDFAVGAPSATWMLEEEGSVAIFLGSASGPADDPDFVLVNLAGPGDFGYALAGGLDTDGDGALELLVASPTWTGLCAACTTYVFVYEFNDADGDHSVDPVDCDDQDPNVFPGAVDVCDDLDNDCDGAVETPIWFADDDGDGYGDPSSPVESCTAPPGTVADSTDCDDGIATVHPGAPESCDGVDNDCNGVLDDTAPTWARDEDIDGFGDAAQTTTACTQPAGYVSDPTDCDDTDPDTWPGAVETCDGTDDDCDGAVDEAGASGETWWYPDGDGDGYGVTAMSTLACDSPAGHVALDGDCDDGLVDVNPGAAEVCGGADEDCDGAVDEAGALGESIWYADDDLDGFGDDAVVVSACGQPVGHIGVAGDCDDDDATVSPSGVEVCGGGDEDCDGAIDEAGADGERTWFHDFDRDGWGDDTTTAYACDPPDGYVAVGGDCDDTRSGTHPDGTEVCGGADEDCDGGIDEVGAEGEQTFWTDGDRDGYGSAADPLLACVMPDGFATNDDDCDDANADAFPGAADPAGDGVDQDCDGADEVTPGSSTGEAPKTGGEAGCGCDVGPGRSSGALGLALAGLLTLRRRSRSTVCGDSRSPSGARRD